MDFTVGGVAFVYNTGVSQNYFANSGRLAIADGLRLRIAYLPEDGPVRRIVRVERLP